MKTPKILFLATEDWFVASHFRPLLRRARADGFEVVIAARASGALEEDEGYRIAPMPFARRALAPGDIWRETRAVQKLLEAEQPDLVHAIALKPIALALLARTIVRTPIVMALTGRGYLEARGGWRRIILDAIAKRMRAAVAGGEALLLTENEADQKWVEAGAPLPGQWKLVMPGAGVDPDAFRPSPEPPPSPIVVGVAARLVRSKGVDLAVAAVTRLRDEGLAIELCVAGAVDPDNPEHVVETELACWRATPGVSLLGRIADVNAFWANAHIACLPSRGGEGLPRSLLEAAACGRRSSPPMHPDAVTLSLIQAAGSSCRAMMSSAWPPLCVNSQTMRPYAKDWARRAEPAPLPPTLKRTLPPALRWRGAVCSPQ